MTLGRKIFLTNLLVVVGVLGGSLLLMQSRANSAADESIARSLTATRLSIEDALDSRSNALLTGASRLAQVPTYLARIESSLMSGDRSDLLDQADEFRQQLRADWVLLTDRYGELRAWTLYPGIWGEDLAAGSLIGIALEGNLTEGLWIEPGADGRDVLYQAVGVPLLDPAGISNIGTLVAAVEIGDDFVEILKAHTMSEILFFTIDPDSERPVPAVATMSDSGLTEALRAVDFMPALGMGYDTTRILLSTGGETMVGALGPLRTAGGSLVGGYVGLRSREKELATYTQLKQTILWAFAGGIVLSLFATLMLTRQITRPVTALVAATRELAEGAYDGEVAVTSNDEIGELATAFGKLARELKEKDELLEYLNFTDDAATVVMGTSPSATVGTMSQTTSKLVNGDIFAGRYRIGKVLGTGGMGVVYRAHDIQLDEPVAIKTLKAEALAADESMLERFKQEIRLARRITHRNVVRTHDMGDVDGVYYITMELVEGTTLSELIQRRGKLPVSVTITVARQLLRALEVAHEQGIVHRDIKPQNIIVDPSGFLKVMDFGIATLTEGRKAPRDRLTGHGAILGTPHYMSPEQLMGEPVDTATDIYATGAVLFECLTGEPLFDADSLPALIVMHLDEEPRNPSDLDPEIPTELSAIILKAIAKKPADRWANVAEFRDALGGLPHDGA